MSLKLLTEHHLEFLSLRGGCTGSSESTLFKKPHFWKSLVTAHIKLTYNMMLNDLRTFLAKSSSAISVKSLLDNLKFGHVWIELGLVNINMF